jgi:hypothetical protein
MDLTREEWLQIKAVLKAARTFVKTYEHSTEHPFDGVMFDDLKKAIENFDRSE